MKKNKFINEDLKSLQDLQGRYETKLNDITRRILDENYKMSPEEIKELKKINNKLEEIKKQMQSTKKSENGMAKSKWLS
jgi:ElaB/YqjD/DUF883 family membrane-anchored ribosome-binding protein